MSETSLGHIYVLKNPHMPALVKIGYTDRSPELRAAELSKGTGVPGHFRVEKSWQVPRASYYEQRLFNELKPFRTSGEHFNLTVDEATSRIGLLLTKWGLASPDGSTPADRAEFERQILQAQERQRAQEEAARRRLQSEARAVALRNASTELLEARRGNRESARKELSSYILYQRISGAVVTALAVGSISAVAPILNAWLRERDFSSGDWLAVFIPALLAGIYIFSDETRPQAKPMFQDYLRPLNEQSKIYILQKYQLNEVDLPNHAMHN